MSFFTDIKKHDSKVCTAAQKPRMAKEKQRACEVSQYVIKLHYRATVTKLHGIGTKVYMETSGTEDTEIYSHHAANF